MIDETRVDEIQILAHQLREASGQTKEDGNDFLEQAQRQILEEKSKKANINLDQHKFPPKPVMENPIIDNQK